MNAGSGSTLYASKGLDGEIVSVRSDKDIETFLADKPEILDRYKKNFTKYKGEEIVSRWQNFINAILSNYYVAPAKSGH
jgi:isoleucyl-tRNA synthetase